MQQEVASGAANGRRRGRHVGRVALAVLGLAIAALVLPAAPAAAEECEEGLTTVLVDGEWYWAENICVYGYSTPGGGTGGPGEGSAASPVKEPGPPKVNPPPDPPKENAEQTPPTASCDDLGNTSLEACKERAESICKGLGVAAGVVIGPKVGKSGGSGPVGLAAYELCRQAYLRVCQRIAQEEVQECRTGECASLLYTWCSLSSSSSEPGLGPPIQQPEDDTYWDKHH
jgi:hypothetical protein